MPIEVTAPLAEGFCDSVTLSPTAANANVFAEGFNGDGGQPDGMQTISLSREIAAPEGTVREAILDVGPFMRAAEFDEVTVADGTIEIANTVGFLRIELALDVVDRPDAVLAYEQREGIFETMDTEYRLMEADGTTVTATTEFAVDAAFVGPVFDATVVKRQRRRELENQFDYLQETCE